MARETITETPWQSMRYAVLRNFKVVGTLQEVRDLEVGAFLARVMEAQRSSVLAIMSDRVPPRAASDDAFFDPFRSGIRIPPLALQLVPSCLPGTCDFWDASLAPNVAQMRRCLVPSRAAQLLAAELLLLRRCRRWAVERRD